MDLSFRVETMNHNVLEKTDSGKWYRSSYTTVYTVPWYKADKKHRKFLASNKEQAKHKTGNWHLSIECRAATMLEF